MDNQRYSSHILVKRSCLSATPLLALVGCNQRTVIVEDPNDHDSHRWDDHEVSAYQRWGVERQKPHQEFARRTSEEQSDYWNWRHSHPDQR